MSEEKASFIFNGQRVEIARGSPNATSVAVEIAAAARECGARCIAPMQVAPGVQTLGEIEVLDYLVTQVAGNKGLMVDARSPQERARGFIPGSVSLPAGTVSPGNSFRKDILAALGAREFEGVYNFTDARSLLVYDNGPSSDEAGRLVANLLESGYPPEMISYYRGGMQVWSVLGFSIEQEQS